MERTLYYVRLFPGTEARYDLDIIAEIEAPAGGLIWFDQIFHTDAPAPDGPSERGMFTMVIDPHDLPTGLRPGLRDASGMETSGMA